MMHIRLTEISLPDGWIQKAQDALDEVRNAPADKRNALIESKRAIWHSLVKQLRDLSNSKCWYSEAPQSGADQDVDHYRPKNRVAENKDHGGYWWLAFDQSNFRLSCTYCNQRRTQGDTKGGKWDHFPLLVEGDRICDECEPARLARETPLLLDPCDESEVALLYFDDDGVPRIPEKIHENLEKKLRTSIRLYHLDHDSFVKGRNIQLDLAKKALKGGMEAFEAVANGDNTQRQRVADSISSLRQLLMPDKPYTSAVKCFLRGRRHEGHPWIEQALGI